MPLDAAAARRGIEAEIGEPLGASAVEAAHGIVSIATAKMSLAVRAVSVERGYDPRDFALVAIGGAGPLHAVEIARDLKIPTVIVPNLPAHFSALGMLMADVRQDYVRTYYRPLVEADHAELGGICAELLAAGHAALANAGIEPAERRFQYAMDLRYVGQEFWLPIPVSEAEIRSGDREAIERRFTEIHDRRFGHAALDEPLELVNLRLTAVGARPRLELPTLAQGAAAAWIGSRPVYLQTATEATSCSVYRRERFGAGDVVTGPAVIEEYASTTVLFPGDTLTVASTGELVIAVHEG
jgi:N-methylhydantoinase A